MPRVCECGCGGYVNFGNRFIHGHNWKGKYHLKETLIKMSNRVFSGAHRKRLSESAKARKPVPQTKEWILKRVESLKGKKRSEESRKRMSEARKGIVFSEEHKKHLSESLKGRTLSDDAKRHLSDLYRGVKRKPLSEKTKRKMSETKKKQYQDLGFKNRMVQSSRLGLHIRPNKVEMRLSEFLNNQYPGEWKYVGDGSFVIAGKNPDFININGRKLIIELFGDYWHKGEDPSDRAAIFEPYGFRTLVIWEHELKDMGVMGDKVVEFIGE